MLRFRRRSFSATEHLPARRSSATSVSVQPRLSRIFAPVVSDYDRFPLTMMPLDRESRLHWALSDGVIPV